MKKLLIFLMALMLVLSLGLTSCDKKNDDENEPITTESETVKEPEKTPQATTKVEKQCTVSVKLDNGDSLSGVKLTLKCGTSEYALETGADGTVEAKLVLGKYTISYDYDTLPSGCAPDTFSIEITANTAEILLMVVDNNPNGTAAKPFFIVEDITPLELEAECEVYYIYRGAAMRYLIVENDGVVITYKDEEYTAVDGKVMIPITPQLGEMSRFSIKNTTDAKLEISIFMEAPKGSMENPIAIEGSSAQASVPAEGAVYYKYVADKTGVLVVSSENTLNNISLSNLNTYAVTSATEGAKGTYMYVSAGDEVLIEVSSTDEKNAVVIDFAVNCYAGTETDPVPVLVESIDLSIPADAEIIFSAAAGKTVSFSNRAVTLTVGGEDYSGQSVEVVLAGSAGTVTFKLTNTEDSLVHLVFDVE